MPTPTIDTCRLELEDREFLAGLVDIPKAFKTFARPDSVGVEWHKTENQLQLGSCQGNGLTSCGERCQFVVTGQVQEQLSRIWAYLATQKLDGLLYSDRGSTISGGAKLIRDYGIPPEKLTGYPNRYPSRTEIDRLLSQEFYDAAKPFKALSLWKVPEDPEEAKNWIGGGGAISIGIAWPGLPANRRITRYTGGSGGHAVAVLGYDLNWLIAINSWGDGPFWISNDAWRQMWRHSYTAMVGISGFLEPEPKRINIKLDW